VPIEGVAGAVKDLITQRYLRALSVDGKHSRGNSIDNNGWVAGYSHLNDSFRYATLWIGDRPLDLGTLGSPNPDKNSSVAWPVKNTGGVIVGFPRPMRPTHTGRTGSAPRSFLSGYQRALDAHDLHRHRL
jgi:hypothetical protein